MFCSEVFVGDDWCIAYGCLYLLAAIYICVSVPGGVWCFLSGQTGTGKTHTMQGAMLCYARVSVKSISFSGMVHLSVSFCALFLPFIMSFSLTCTICRYTGPSTDPGIITRTVEDIYKVL